MSNTTRNADLSARSRWQRGRRQPASSRAGSVLAILFVALSASLGAQAPPNSDRIVPQPGDRVAVVPFTNISGLPADDWIGAGFAETVAVDLERIANVTTVDGGVADGLPPREVGLRLGTGWVVAGAYQRIGERVRITARLVHVETGAVSRTANVTGPLGELFALQDTIAGALARDHPASITEQAVTPPEPAPAPVIGPPGRRPAPPAAVAAAGAAGFAPGASGAVIDGPPAPVPPEVVTRDADGRATMLAFRLSGGLDLDGSLREAVYEQIRPVSGFVQQFPDEGAPATERTEVWVFYDEENVYVAARCWDSAPEDQWIANEMQRDSFQMIQNDRIVVASDTFYDRRNGMAFLVNPIGGFIDVEITDEGSPNIDWNPVWDQRTGRFEGGWTVEMQVPFKSLRFQQGQSQLWGIQFERQVRRKNEVSHLTPVPIAVVGAGITRLSAAATLAGLEVPSQNRRLEVKPYAIGSAATDLTADPPFSNRGAGDAGVDAKWGVTQNLTANFTYNTDFAQKDVAIPIGGYGFQDVFLSYLMGSAAAGVRHHLRAARDVLRRRHHRVRIPPGAHRADAAVVDRTDGRDQPHRPAAGAVHRNGRDDPRDLHVHVPEFPVGARAVQLEPGAARDQRPFPLGVQPGQRAVRGLQRSARHHAARRAAAREPRLHRQGHAAPPILTNRALPPTAPGRLP